MNKPTWFTVRAQANAPTEILIYDQIGKGWFDDDGISAKEFAEALKDIDPKDEIIVRINSPGGNVWDGLAIFNQLRSRKDKVKCVVDGVAASIASVIALGGRTLEVPKNAMMMIHDCSALGIGNAEQMRKLADKLDQHSDMLAGIYAEKTGKSREKMRALMREETWFTGEEAGPMGFADTVTEEIKLAASASFDFSTFRRVPAVLGQHKTQPPLPAAGQHNTEVMQKDKIIALLKEHGKTIDASATDEQFLAALKDLVLAGKLTQQNADALKAEERNIIIPEAEYRRWQQNAETERRHRITNEVRNLMQDRPYIKDQEARYIDRAMKDEDVLNDLRAMPISGVSAGADPLRIRPNVENLGSALVEKYRAMEPGKDRMQFHLKNWTALEDAHAEQHIQAMSSLPMQEQLRRLQDPRAVATNTYNASLVTDMLADSFITTIGTRLAPLAAFSRNFGTDRMKPRATVQVPKATVASTTLTNATDFEQYDSTTTNVAISVAQITQPFAVTNDELNKGHRLATVAVKNAQAFGNAISDVWTALVTTANFGTALSIGAAANFDAADLAPILEVAKNYGIKSLLLDGGHWAYLLPQTRENFSFAEQAGGAFGFDRIAAQNRWTGATTNTVGFVCDPNAIAVGSGLPLDLPAGDFIELGTVSVPDLDLTAQVCHWFSRKGRVHFMTYDVMFGAAAGDTTAGELLAST